MSRRSQRCQHVSRLRIRLQIEPECGHRIIAPELPIHTKAHQDVAAIVSVLAIHSSDREYVLARSCFEREPIAHFEPQAPREWLGDDYGPPVELRPHPRRIALHEL